jgi:hypothetical protein
MPIEFSNGDFRRVKDAVDLTRRMRSAGLSSGTGLGEERADVNKVFHDAEKLVHTSADLVLSYVSNLPSDTQRVALDKTLDENWQEYEEYPPYHKAQTSVEDSADNIMKDVNRLKDDWREAMSFFDNGVSGMYLSGEEILTQNIGIVAPLSTDYHRAVVYKKYVEEIVGRPTFDLAPVVVDPIHDRVIFPEENTHIIFEDKPNIGVYIDISGYGDTLWTLKKAFRERYGRKIT